MQRRICVLFLFYDQPINVHRVSDRECRCAATFGLRDSSHTDAMYFECGMRKVADWGVEGTAVASEWSDPLRSWWRRMVEVWLSGVPGRRNWGKRSVL